MEEEEVGQIAPEDAETGVDFNAMMRRMARESIAGAGPSISIDAEILRETAATLAQKAIAILGDESAKGRPIGSVNDIAGIIARRLYQSLNAEEESITAPTPEKVTQRPLEKLTSDSLEEYKSLGTPYGEVRQKFVANLTQAKVPQRVAEAFANAGITDRDEVVQLLGTFEQESSMGLKMFENGGVGASGWDSETLQKYNNAPGLGFGQITGKGNWIATAEKLVQKRVFPESFDPEKVIENNSEERKVFIERLSDPKDPAAAMAAVGFYTGWTYGSRKNPQTSYISSRNAGEDFVSRANSVADFWNPHESTEVRQKRIARHREWNKELEEAGI